jgi:hypothetical protein
MAEDKKKKVEEKLKDAVPKEVVDRVKEAVRKDTDEGKK